MRFNFPNKEESVLVNIKFKPDMFRAIRDIAENEECLRSETIIVLLEAAIEEYNHQKSPPKDTAYPINPNKESNPDETEPIKETKEKNPEVNQYGHKIVGWSYAHDACIKCGTTNSRHAGRGLCTACYAKKDTVKITEEDPENFHCEQCGKVLPEDDTYEHKNSLYCKDCCEKLEDSSDSETKKKKSTMLASGGWAVGFSECVKCHTTDRKHLARGYCSLCYYREKKTTKYPGLTDKELEKLPKDWYKEENLKREAEMYLYCANPNCKKYKFGKFLKGKGVNREGKDFCSTICADEIAPIRQPLPENFVWAYCQYLLCDKKKYVRDDGIEADGKNFCSEKCYASWTQSIKNIAYN